jgi:hypothetical protein
MPEDRWIIISKSAEQRLYGYQELIPLETTHEDRKWIDLITKRVQREGRWSPAARRSRKDKSPEKDRSANCDETIDGVLINEVSHTPKLIEFKTTIAKRAPEFSPDVAIFGIAGSLFGSMTFAVW